MQASAIVDSRASRAVWAEVHVKERRAAAHDSSRALGLPEAVPVEVAVEVRCAPQWVDHGREAEVDLVASRAPNTQADESSRFPLTRTDESGRTRDFAYDALGGLESVTDLSGAAWDYDYTTIAASDLEVSVEGGTVSLVASEGESDVYRFGGGPSAAGQEARVPAEDMDVWQEALASVTSPEGSTTSYHYDAGGHRDRITLPNGHEELRTWTAGHLDLVTLPFGTTLDYTRDAAFRVTSRTGTDGSSLAFTYGPQDRIATATDETGTVTHEYDAVGRETGIVHPTGARVGRSYDAIDQTRHITVRGSATGTVRDTEYVYDDANRLSEVHDPLGGVTTYAYDDDSRLTSRTLPNGVTTTWTYNARGWVMSVTHRRADTSVIASRTYERSPSGEPTRITNHDGSYVLITYDDALRVQSEAYRTSAGGVIENIEYTYDLDGNRTTRRRGATIATSTLEEYTYAPGDELTAVSVGGSPTQTWEHDFAGRTTRITRSGHDQHLAYDADDHITSIVDGTAETRWQFDAEGRRTRREDLSGGITDSAHRYVQGPTTDASLDSAHMVTSDAGAPELGYVFAPIPGGAEHPLFRYDPVTGEAIYYLQDSMGSVIGLVDQTTTQTATFEYDGFGGERASTGTLAGLPVASRGDYRFHGMWLDSSVGLYYVRARVYDAGVGRFLSNDPAEGRRARPETHEMMRAMLGNPLSARDSCGRNAITMGDVSLGPIGAAILATVAIGTLAITLLQAIRVAWSEELIGIGVSVPRTGGDDRPRRRRRPRGRRRGGSCEDLWEFCISPGNRPWRYPGGTQRCNDCLLACIGDGGTWPFELCNILADARPLPPDPRPPGEE
jgi:RHS repeat-associated protein